MKICCVIGLLTLVVALQAVSEDPAKNAGGVERLLEILVPTNTKQELERYRGRVSGLIKASGDKPLSGLGEGAAKRYRIWNLGSWSDILYEIVVTPRGEAEVSRSVSRRRTPTLYRRASASREDQFFAEELVPYLDSIVGQVPPINNHRVHFGDFYVIVIQSLDEEGTYSDILIDINHVSIEFYRKFDAIFSVVEYDKHWKSLLSEDHSADESECESR